MENPLKPPVELVFGRKPRDVVTIENSYPEQLSVPVSSLEQMDQTLQQMVMTYYLEARQRADLRRDIAARLLPTEGPYSPSDRVYYWQVDTSKIKHGVTSGRWFKERVLSPDGAICVIDTGTTVRWVNQSKLRKEKGMESQIALVPRERSDV